MKNFKKLLMLAKMGDKEALQQIVEMYGRLVSKESAVNGIYDEDLRQVLFKTLLMCVRAFEI